MSEEKEEKKCPYCGKPMQYSEFFGCYFECMCHFGKQEIKEVNLNGELMPIESTGEISGIDVRKLMEGKDD